jgi:hypothetical protein
VSDRYCPEPAPGAARPPGLDGDAAVDLLLANTGPSQTVVDLDDDPVLRAAAHTTGRRYHALPPRLQTRRAPALQAPDADLVTLAWPRPHDPTPAASAHALTVAAGLLLPGGHVALLLEPTISQAYTITWTGAVLAAAHAAGLDYLQDVICLHHAPDDPPDHPAGDTGIAWHRVVLVLRHQAGLHA